MLRSADEHPAMPVKMTPLGKKRSATPLFSPGHNDDETEKQAARQARQLEQKSRHLSLMSPVVSSPKAAKAKIPAAAANLNASRLNLSSSMAAAAPLDASSSSLPAAAAVVKLTREQMAKTFDEWMKIAADNKINAKNSWSFALIDYFSELSLLRDGEGINFQKASCTLDGCVKIYTSRIDSAADETGQLLVGLATEGLEDGENETSHKSTGGALSRKRAAGQGGAESTLAKTAESLNARSYDLEFSVDPLFKKTCADFDESGSHGKLLLNHLTLSSAGSVLLDASQARFDAACGSAPQTPLGELVQLDSSWLVDGLDSREIIPSLAAASAAFDLNLTLENLSRLSLAPEPSALHASPFGPDGPGQQDAPLFSTPTPFEDGDSLGELDEVPEPEPANRDIRLANLNSSLLPSSSSSLPETSGPAVAQTEALGWSLVSASLFGRHVGTTEHWAGPEHWKISRAYPNLLRSASQAAQAAAPPKRPAKSRPAAAFEPFDFTAAPQVDIKVLFAAPSSLASITLPGDSVILNSQRARSRNLLPVDLGLDSKALLGLFSKPGQLLEGRLERIAIAATGPAMENKQSSHLSPSFATTDAEDEPFDEDGYEGPALSSLAQSPANAPSQPQPQPADFPVGVTQPLSAARFAKRVDVHLLKENLLSVLSPTRPAFKAQGLLFSSALQELKSCYAESDWHQVSPAYCFVSLLHLANEQNLSLTSLNSGSDLVVRSN